MCLRRNLLYNSNCFPGSRLPLTTGLSPRPAWPCLSAISTCEPLCEKVVCLCWYASPFPTVKAALLSCEAETAEQPLTSNSTRCPLLSPTLPSWSICFFFIFLFFFTSCLAFSPGVCFFFSPKCLYCFSLLYPTSIMISRDHPTSYG